MARRRIGEDKAGWNVYTEVTKAKDGSCWGWKVVQVQKHGGWADPEMCPYHGTLSADHDEEFVWAVAADAAAKDEHGYIW